MRSTHQTVSSRPKRSAMERPASLPTTSSTHHTAPSRPKRTQHTRVISTEAQRSGETRFPTHNLQHPPHRAVPTKAHPTHPCHLDRSAAQWRDPLLYPQTSSTHQTAPSRPKRTHQTASSRPKRSAVERPASLPTIPVSHPGRHRSSTSKSLPTHTTSGSQSIFRSGMFPANHSAEDCSLEAARAAQKEPSPNGPRPCPCRGFPCHDYCPSPARHALRERGKRRAVIQPRALVPTRDTCCRATTHHIVERVAGMAFNFSNVHVGRPTGALIEPPPAPPREIHRGSTRPRSSSLYLTKVLLALHALTPGETAA